MANENKTVELLKRYGAIKVSYALQHSEIDRILEGFGPDNDSWRDISCSSSYLQAQIADFKKLVTPEIYDQLNLPKIEEKLKNLEKKLGTDPQ